MRGLPWRSLRATLGVVLSVDLAQRVRRAGLCSPLWPALLAVALSATSLGNGFSTDDYWHREFIAAHLSGEAQTPWWDMFNTLGREGRLDVPALVRAGLLPWWTSPHFSLSALRPLSVVSHYVDYLLWPDSPWLMHAHNLLWLGLLVYLVGRLHRRLLGVGAAALLATLMYAVNEGHALTVGWIAGRNTLMTAVFAALALLVHGRGRRGELRGASLWTALCVGAGLACSEGGLATWGLLVPYAIWLDDRSIRARLGSLAPAGAVTLGWLGLYRALGYGAHGSGTYVNPLGDGPRVVPLLGQRLLVYLREQFFLPAAVAGGWPAALKDAVDLVTWILGGLALLAVGALAWRSARVRFWALAAIVTLLPFTTATPSGRLLLVPSIAGFGLVSEVLVAAHAAWRARAPWPRRALLGTVGGMWALLHLPLAAATAPVLAQSARVLEEVTRASGESFPSGTEVSDKALLVLNTPQYFLTRAAPGRSVARGASAPVFILGASFTPVTLTRRDETTLVLQPRGGYLKEPWSQHFRSPAEPFTPGTPIEVGALFLTVEATTLDGRPARVAIRHPDLDSDAFVWLVWDGERERYEEIELPRPGESMRLVGHVSRD